MARVVVITGGTAGIGLATAEKFAREGWSVGDGADEARLATALKGQPITQVIASPPGGPCDSALRAELRALAGDGPVDDPAVLIGALLERDEVRFFVTPQPRGGFRYDPPWRRVLAWLCALGGIDLSAARLFEGHLNALQLIALYGTAGQQEGILAILRDGGLLGVWGADGDEPVRLTPTGADEWVLAGAKRYASGAGLLAAAVVPISRPDGTLQLLLLPVDDRARADQSSWNMSGMRGSASGTYRFDGIAVTPREIVGAPDDYRREPYFVGGIWRCAAAQLGAVEAIVRVMAEELSTSGRDGHPLQMARIGTAIMKARTARLWVEDAAERVETFVQGGDEAEPARTVALSAYARLATEEAAMTVIDLAERALGLSSFAVGHPAGALMRDLAVYIRQANPDAVLLQHGRVLAAGLST